MWNRMWNWFVCLAVVSGALLAKENAKAAPEAKAGKVDVRMDKTGNVCVIAGKRSFDADKLVANVKAVVSAVQAARPASVKGQFIRSLTVATTMGVGVPVILTADAE